MVTDAVGRDVDGDGRLDLIVVGEWMPITIFHNAGGGKLVRLKTPGLEHSEGWWNRIVAGGFSRHRPGGFLGRHLGVDNPVSASAAGAGAGACEGLAKSGGAKQLPSAFHPRATQPSPQPGRPNP